MATPVAQLLVRIAADTGALVRGGKQSERALDGVGKRAARATKQLATLGTAAAAAGAAALFAMSKHAISVADEIAKTADKLGVGIEALQEWRYAAERAGIESNTFDMALQRFTRRAAEAARGTGEAKDALKTLGISLTDANGQLRPTEKLLGEVADAFKRIPNEGERLRLAFKLFDSEGVKMVNMLRDGAAGVDAMRKKARDLGVVISEDMVRKAEVANDELSDMADVLKVAGFNIALEFMPVMRQLANLFTSGEFQAGVRDAATAMGEFIGWIQDNPELFKRGAGAMTGFMMGSRLGLPGAAVGTIGGALAPEWMGMLLGGDDQQQPDMAKMLGIDGIQAGNTQTEKLLEQRREMWLAHLQRLEDLKNEKTEAEKEAEAKRMLDNVEKLREHLMTEAQLEMTRHQERLEQLKAAFEAELVTREEYADLKEQLEKAHQDKLTEIAKKAAKDRSDVDKREMFGRLNATANFFGDLATLAEAAGDKAFKQQKALAIASALIGSIESATHAFNWGTKIGGPVLGAAFAAAATAAQVARVAQIKAVQPGSGGSASSSAGSFAAPASPAQAANSQQTLLVQGIDANSLWRGDNVRDLAERLIEFQENGGRVVLQ